ncbi:ATPase, AAA family [Oesophagostomum dentatum]|uniref:ATPase, AAA family n=1 Tax=Oesophagostomum dentatum TaxID=61180 RepID=A0A0B1SVJ2_OESDE|nr:ATPase, AAA family [Oesophagostomum dentatum]
MFAIFDSPHTFMVVYNEDTVCVPVHDVFTGEISRYYFKISTDDSPCILDSTASFYQISSVSAPLPYAAQPELFEIPQQMRAIVERMRNITLAHQDTDDKPLVLLLYGAGGSGKRLTATHLAVETHRNRIEMSCYDLWSESIAESEAKINRLFEEATSFQPCILYLSSVDVLAYDVTTNGTDSRIMATFRAFLSKPAQLTVVLSCNSDKVCHLSSSVQSLVLYDFMIEHLNEDARFRFLSSRLPVDLTNYAAKNTAGFVLAELVNLLRDIHFRITTTKADTVEECHVEWAIDKRNASFADVIGAPKVSGVARIKDIYGSSEKSCETSAELAHTFGGT